MTPTNQYYHAMARDLMIELRHTWGHEKFQTWWETNIVSMNGKVLWTYEALYLALKEEHDHLQGLYDQYRAEQQKEETELRRG